MGFGTGSFGPRRRHTVQRATVKFVADDETCNYSGYSYSDAMDSFIEDLKAKNTKNEAEDDPHQVYGVRLGTGSVEAYEVAKWQNHRALPLAPVEEDYEVEERGTEMTYDTDIDQLQLELDWATYRDATGFELEDPPETVAVDRRGYAPAVAEELGEDYMDGQVALFDEEQRYAGYADSFVRQSRPIDDLLDTLYEEPEATPLLGELELSTRDGLRLTCRQVPFLEQVEGMAVYDDVTSLGQGDIQRSTSLSSLTDRASDEDLPLTGYSQELAAIEVDSYGWEHGDGEGIVFDTDPLISIGTSSDVPYDDVHTVELSQERYGDLAPTPGDHFLDLEPQEWLSVYLGAPMEYNMYREDDDPDCDIFRLKLDEETTLTAEQ